MAPPVGILAGRGHLPPELARQLRAVGRDALMAEMAGFPADNPDSVPLIRYRPEKLGWLFRELKARGVAEVVFAGGIARPPLDPKAFDLKTMRLAPRILGAMRGGDDATLRMVLAIFEREGFRVRAAHEIMPQLMPEPGVLTRAAPSERDAKDAARGAQIVAALSAADVGQGAVVAQGVALAVEAAPGTDRMLAWVATEAGAWRPDPASARGCLFKGPKPGQDRRVDLPAIGPDTVVAAAKAGLAGIAIEAGGVMLLNRQAALAAADEAGLFLWARPAEGGR